MINQRFTGRFELVQLPDIIKYFGHPIFQYLKTAPKPYLLYPTI